MRLLLVKFDKIPLPGFWSVSMGSTFSFSPLPWMKLLWEGALHRVTAVWRKKFNALIPNLTQIQSTLVSAVDLCSKEVIPLKLEVPDTAPLDIQPFWMIMKQGLSSLPVMAFINLKSIPLQLISQWWATSFKRMRVKVPDHPTHFQKKTCKQINASPASCMKEMLPADWNKHTLLLSTFLALHHLRLALIVFVNRDDNDTLLWQNVCLQGSWRDLNEQLKAPGRPSKLV